MLRETVEIRTEGRRLYEVSDRIQAVVERSGVQTGLCHLFLHHTSASIILCENADPSVRRDLNAFFARLAPDGDPQWTHRSEGPDDMPAHVRTVLTQNDLTIPVAAGKCDLGAWQGLFVWEHRTRAHRRRLTITVWN